ncbi:TetR/AcrR family transcriptional regulator [Nocardiopsis sp. CNT312]|uniref:TetR/AcrR family transcriptional regulator n=1 Tax=Nocardiopsis sp. CNT312 TaxID=1137268 RepID=UPI00048AAB58|nr:TetR/AcrR family transcriptional regulator [Nocardiopsis sp. CNT312]
MVRNPQRRTALLDAAIDVLAEEGARGLTFRAVDARAGVPMGTASNYFANRDALLSGVGLRAYERFMPAPAEWERVREVSRDRAGLTELMHGVVRRMLRAPEVHLALLELQLEAARRPELRSGLTGRVREDLEANIDLHARAGMPGGRGAVVLLYLALNQLVTEHLTLPGVLAPEGSVPELVAAVVERIVPEG